MSHQFGRLAGAVCAAAATAALAVPAPAVALPGPGPEPEPTIAEERPVAGLLAELRRLYREGEAATEAYNRTEEELARQRAEVRRLERRLAAARRSLRDSRGAVGRLARQQYRSRSDLFPYLRLLLGRDPGRALDQGQVLRRVSLERAGTVARLAGGERHADALAGAARRALTEQRSLAGRREEERDRVRERLREVEELLASIGDAQLRGIAALERDEVAGAQRGLLASGVLDGVRPPSEGGAAALRYVVRQIGKPYAWGAEGPDAYDCSGLTSRAWAHAGRPVPRTSQEQWERLPRVPLGRLRPGDLVVYFPRATHVAVYLGGGLVVHAPHPGARVRVSPLAAGPVLGAVRPDPEGRPLARYRPVELPEGALDGTDEGYAFGGETTAGGRTPGGAPARRLPRISPG